MIYGLAAGMAFMLVEVIRFVRAERKHAALKKRQEEKRLLFMERYSGGLNDEWKRTGEGTVRSEDQIEADEERFYRAGGCRVCGSPPGMPCDSALHS